MTIRADEKTTLVLFSGGMDSTITLHHALDRARKEGGRVHTLSLFYGQRHHTELAAARTILHMIRADDPDTLGETITHRIELPPSDSSLLSRQCLVDKYPDVATAEERSSQDSSFVPYRNVLMLTIAAMYARSLGAGVLATGLRGGFADCTAEFERRMQSLLIMASDYPLRIETPTHLSRADCVFLATTLPGCMKALAHTVTCFEGTTPPCGHCLPCLKRDDGFARAGVADPLIERLSGGGVVAGE